MNMNQIRGKSNTIKGKLKEITGKLFGKQQLETEGKKQKLAGDADFAVDRSEENRKQHVK